MHSKAIISLPSEQEAMEIADGLLDERLLAGTFISQGRSRYHWKGAVEDEDYWRLEAFTLTEHKQAIIDHVEAESSEETPVIAFTEIDGNQDFLDWIEAETR